VSVARIAVLLFGAALGEQLQLELPIQGWTSSAATQVVVSHLRPDLPVDLYWLGWKWLLWPNQAGRAGAYLPVLPQRNLFSWPLPGIPGHDSTCASPGPMASRAIRRIGARKPAGFACATIPRPRARMSMSCCTVASAATASRSRAVGCRQGESCE
jgi:hypothetical protein